MTGPVPGSEKKPGFKGTVKSVALRALATFIGREASDEFERLGAGEALHGAARDFLERVGHFFENGL